jgi:hypothetical protein
MKTVTLPSSSSIPSSVLFVATNENIDIEEQRLVKEKATDVQDSVVTVASTATDGSSSSSSSSLTPEDKAVLFGHDQLEQRHPPFPSRHRPNCKDRNGNILEDKRLPLDSLDHSSTNQ